MSGDQPGRGRGGGRGGGRGRGRGDQSVPFHPRGGGGGGDGYRGRGRGDQSGSFHPRGGGPGRGGFDGGRGRGGGPGRGGFDAGRGRGGGRGAPIPVEVFRQDAPASINRDVERIENQSLVEAKKAKLVNANPQRPGYGVKGKEVLLYANYFQLQTKKDIEFYRYNIGIAADAKGKAPGGKKANRIIQLFLHKYFPAEAHDIATDYRSTMISRSKLVLKEQKAEEETEKGKEKQETGEKQEGEKGEEDSYIVHYMAEDEETPSPKAPSYRIVVLPTGSLTLSELVNHLTSTQAGLMLGSQEEIIQALNIVLGHYPKSEPSTVTIAQRRHFSLVSSQDDQMSLGGGLQVIRGFFMSARAATARVLLNVQVKNMAFYEEKPLNLVMNDYMHSNGPNLRRLARFLKKVSVDVTHITRKNSKGQRIARIKMIQDFATKDDGHKMAHRPIMSMPFGAGAKDVQFFLEQGPGTPGQSAPAAGGGGKKGKKAPKAGPAPAGRYVTVFDFFKETYNITLQDLSCPVINVATKENPVYLPAEVCIVRPGQPARAKLSGPQTQQMIKFAVRRPINNARSVVTSGRQLLGFDPTNPTLDAFGIGVPPGLMTVPGRVLPVPQIRYGGKDPAVPRFGSWNMQSVKFAAAAKLTSWTWLLIAPQGARNAFHSKDEFDAKIREFQYQLNQLGLTVSNPMPGTRINAAPQNIEAEIDLKISQMTAAMVLVIIPDGDNAVIYNRVKYACDVKHGLLNVCVRDYKFSKANAQYMANVGLKFNLKLGGRNHAVDRAKLGLVAEKKTMVVGIDVTHPSPGSADGAPSVAGVVASVDEHLAQWPADLRVQKGRQERVADLGDMVAGRLALWRRRNNNHLPENLLIFRDGVSEGQHNMVVDEEIADIRAACARVYPAPPSGASSSSSAAAAAARPRITVIIVGKRHHTRFYSTRLEDADRSGNPVNGTVVDRGVTDARRWDFFLQAHTALQGTARPAHYHVVYDQLFRDPKVNKPSPMLPTGADSLEDLTHNLCYLFGRATKAVSVCPPAYYADLVCERARCYLSGLYDPATPDATSVAGTSTTTTSQQKKQQQQQEEEEQTNRSRSLIAIHPRVRDSMFYV
ncbi:RNA interference and gene silencing protein [Xylariaceae sp. FL0804]|nr:RNA interference and gene silencing protein [Xylariaceae sp. FL0804]